MRQRTTHWVSQFRPGFLARLGVLLIFQVVFLFVAVGLVLFVPEKHTDSSSQSKQIDGLFSDIAKAMGSPSGLDLNPWNETDIKRRLDAVLTGSSQISGLTIFQVEPEHRRLYSWKAPQSSVELIRREAEPDSTQLTALVGLLEKMPDAYKLHLTEHNVIPLHFERFDLGTHGKIVVAAEGITDFVVSSKSSLLRAIPILFLTSTLVSLLIVYLLWKRYKKPLEELARAVETSAGPAVESSTRVDSEEVEIARLAAGLGRMADSRHKDQQAIREADQRVIQAKDALEESRQFLKTIIERSPSGMIVTDGQGRIVIFNRAAAESFGYADSEILGRPVTMLFALPGQRGDAANGVGGSEVVCWRKDQESFPAFVVSADISAGSATEAGRVYILRDIAESRSYQDMMVRLDRNVTRGAMAADIGHEINNFLAVLLGNLELLPRSIAKGDEPGIKKKLDTMKANVEKISRFADGLMVESCNEELQCSSISANQIVENVIAFLRYQNRFDGVDWVVQLRPDLPMAMIDDARVQQVMVNLLYNAAEALGEVEGNHVITVTSKPSTRDGMPVVRVDVIDNGPGVQKDKEPLLFRARFTTKKKGHGFGLMTCGRIVRQHGGWIGYSYENGAHFWFELPLEQVVSPVATSADAAPALV